EWRRTDSRVANRPSGGSMRLVLPGCSRGPVILDSVKYRIDTGLLSHRIRRRSPVPASALARDVDTVRRFNRFYTRQIGVLQEKLLHSPFSLTEGRVL